MFSANPTRRHRGAVREPNYAEVGEITAGSSNGRQLLAAELAALSGIANVVRHANGRSPGTTQGDEMTIRPMVTAVVDRGTDHLYEVADMNVNRVMETMQMNGLFSGLAIEYEGAPMLSGSSGEPQDVEEVITEASGCLVAVRRTGRRLGSVAGDSVGALDCLEEAGIVVLRLFTPSRVLLVSDSRQVVEGGTILLHERFAESVAVAA